MGEFLADFPVITTNRLVIREPQEKDAELLYQEFANPNVTRYLDWGGPHSTEQALACIADWRDEFEKKNFISWAIAEKNTDEFLGTIVISTRNRDPQYGLFTHEIAEVISLGYNLREEHWGKGYMTEAVTAVLALVFDNIRTPRVEACVHPENTASLKLLEKLHFSREGLLRKYWFNNQTRRHDDMVILSILPQEFEVN
jgi:Acetyltransferases, including N-acetylases of ribosomal proteins